MPRFVVLEHDWPTLHWDLLFEAGPVLKAWRLLAEPGNNRAVPAEPNFDHRLVYLEYEGPLSRKRGTVRRWDAGDFEGSIGSGVCLTGQKLQGRAEIVAVGERWEFRLTGG